MPQLDGFARSIRPFDAVWRGCEHRPAQREGHDAPGGCQAAGDDPTQHGRERTLTLAEIGGPSPFIVSDANVRIGGTVMQGPRAAGSRAVPVPRGMSVLIENLGDFPIGYDIA